MNRSLTGAYISRYGNVCAHDDNTTDHSLLHMRTRGNYVLYSIWDLSMIVIVHSAVMQFSLKLDKSLRIIFVVLIS